jgi:tetratricopeptide (TPR) repeat protein
MNRQQFIGYIKAPESLNSESLKDIENLATEYPFCHAADVLYALNLFKENHFRYSEQLKIASAYAPDRKVLKLLLAKVQKTKSPAAEIRQHVKIQPDQEVISLIDHLKKEIELAISGRSFTENPDTTTLLKQVAEQLEKLIGMKKLPEPSEQKPNEANQTVSREYNFDHLEEIAPSKTGGSPKDELIDKFIREEPRIAHLPRASFFDPVATAKQSIEDNDSIVSETLAEIYYKQGNLSRAIKIYKKLSLVNPQKRNYFAAQIEKIRKEIK